MSGVKGQKWYHRYHQSYKTKPTRSGKVGTEHMSLSSAYNKFMEDGYWVTRKKVKKLEKKIKRKSFFNKKNNEKINEKYKQQLEEAQKELNIDDNILDAINTMILEKSAEGLVNGDDRISMTNNNILSMMDQWPYAMQLKVSKKEIEKYIDKYQKEIEKGKDRRRISDDILKKYFGGKVKLDYLEDY